VGRDAGVLGCARGFLGGVNGGGAVGGSVPAAGQWTLPGLRVSALGGAVPGMRGRAGAPVGVRGLPIDG